MTRHLATLRALVSGAAKLPSRLYLRAPAVRRVPHYHLVVELHPRLKAAGLAADNPVPPRCNRTQDVGPGRAGPFEPALGGGGVRKSPQFDSVARGGGPRSLAAWPLS
jgi:hypothetical protein